MFVSMIHIAVLLALNGGSFSELGLSALALIWRHALVPASSPYRGEAALRRRAFGRSDMGGYKEIIH